MKVDFCSLYLIVLVCEPPFWDWFCVVTRTLALFGKVCESKVPQLSSVGAKVNFLPRAIGELSFTPNLLIFSVILPVLVPTWNSCCLLLARKLSITDAVKQATRLKWGKVAKPQSSLLTSLAELVCVGKALLCVNSSLKSGLTWSETLNKCKRDSSVSFFTLLIQD